MRLLVAALVALALVLPALPATMASAAWHAGRNDYRITVRDGTILDATMIVPPGTAQGERLAAIVVLHGYGGSKDVSDAARAAERGFVGFAYTARGFGDSTGLMDVAGPASVADAKEMVAWLAANGPVDASRIGMVGASYGGGTTLQVATDPASGVAAFAPVAFWSDFERALEPNGAFKLSYVTGFYATGEGFVQDGDAPMRLEVQDTTLSRRCLCDTYDPSVHRWYTEELLGVDAADAHAALQARSAWPNLSRVTKPIFMAQGLNDDLFPADEALDAFARVSSAEKKLYLGYVGHPRASASGPEVDYVLDEILAFFEHVLQGKGPRPFDAARAIELGERPWTGRTRNLSAWPSGGELWHLDAGGVLSPGFGPRGFEAIGNTLVMGGPDDPVLGAEASDEARALPASTPVDTRVYRTSPFSAAQTLLGTPRVDLALTPLAPAFEVAAKLYDVAPDGSRELLSRGVWTNGAAAVGTMERVIFDLEPYSASIAEGHALELRVSASDFPAFRPVTTPFAALVSVGAGGSVVTLPLAPASPA